MIVTYIEVCAEGPVGDGRGLLVGEEEHLGLGRVLFFKRVNVRGGDLDDSVSDVLVDHLLELVSVELLAGLAVVQEDGGWYRWVDLVGRELGDAFLVTD